MDYEVVEAKPNLHFIFASKTIYIQTTHQTIRLDCWTGKDKKIRELKKMIARGVISDINSLTHHASRKKLFLTATARRFTL